MPRWPQAPGAEDRLQAALTAWRVGGLYGSAEACAKAHGVPPTTFRKRLQGKHRSYYNTLPTSIVLLLLAKQQLFNTIFTLLRLGFYVGTTQFRRLPPLFYNAKTPTFLTTIISRH